MVLFVCARACPSLPVHEAFLCIKTFLLARVLNDSRCLSAYRINAFLEGFYDIIPKRLISIFNEQELELLISGLPNVDIEDLRANTEYHKYQPTSLQVRISMDTEERNEEDRKSVTQFSLSDLLPFTFHTVALNVVVQ